MWPRQRFGLHLDVFRVLMDTNTRRIMGTLAGYTSAREGELRSMSWKTTALLCLPALLILACSSDSAVPVPAPAATVTATVESAPTSSPPASEEPFVIGAMDALTGVAESYGNPLLQAKLLAVEEINAGGGINGRQLKLIVEDSKCAAQDAITAYNKLTDVDGVKIVLGTTCSGSMLGAAPLAEEEGVILFSASATSPDIASAGDYIFRTAINDQRLGIDMGNTLWVDGVRKIVTITEAHGLRGGHPAHCRRAVREAGRLRASG